MKKMTAIFAVILFLAACTEEPVIVKSNSPPEDPDQEPEIVEQESDGDEETDEFIEFALPEEEIMVNLKMVPILNSYLQTMQDRQQAIEEMNLNRLNSGNQNHYILEFSCHGMQCSYLLLDQTEENRAFLIADLAKLFQTTISPDKTKVLFHFNREQSSQPPYSDIVVMDLEKWEPATLYSQTSEENVLDYTRPILAVEWNEDNTISATVPDLTAPSPETLEQWENSEKPTTKIEFTLGASEDSQ